MSRGIVKNDTSGLGVEPRFSGAMLDMPNSHLSSPLDDPDT